MCAELGFAWTLRDAPGSSGNRSARLNLHPPETIPRESIQSFIMLRWASFRVIIPGLLLVVFAMLLGHLHYADAGGNAAVARMVQD